MLHILSIGRDPMLLETRKLLLEVFGCTVTTVTSIDEAVSACDRQRFEAAILCHTLREDEIRGAYEALRACVPGLHVVRLERFEDAGYNPATFVHRVRRAASSMQGAA